VLNIGSVETEDPLVLFACCKCFTDSCYAASTPGHVARKHVSRMSNLYQDTYMSTDTCHQIQVARSGYMLTVSQQYNCDSFTSRSTCIQQQTGDKIQETCRRQQVDTTRRVW